MSKLREQMIIEMDLRGFSQKTKVAYIRHIEKFTRYFKKSPEKLGEAEIKTYLHYLLIQKNMSQSYNSIAYSALKFLYANTLKQDWNQFRIPRSKKAKRLPVVLSREEVKKIFDATNNLKHKAIFMTIYAAGLRVSEAANLKISDIDSNRMQLRIQGGKGRKDRYTLLSATNLNILRQYWNTYRPRKWLFPGVSGETPITIRTIQKVFGEAIRKAGITKRVSVHTLRHSFATHLLDSGADVYHIQKLMGHSSIRTTAVYIHISQKDSLKLTSPLESIMGGQDD